MGLFSPDITFIWSANTDGLAIRFANPKHYEKTKLGFGDDIERLGLIRMQMLAESGQAKTRELASGIFIEAADAVRLDVETRDGFQLPPPWPGGMRLKTDSVPQSSGFAARLALVDSVSEVYWDWQLRGPILEVGQVSYLPTAAQYAALLAVQIWTAAAKRGEVENLSLLVSLREAHNAGLHIDLEAYHDTRIAKAQELSVDARPEGSSGDLILRPVVSGDFPALSVEEIEERLGQLANDAPRAVLRVGQTIVLLDLTQTAQVRALIKRGRVPQAAVPSFQSDPSAWMAQHIFPDIETEFSPRVTGIGFWKAAYAGSMWEEGEDWFGKKPQPEKRPSSKNSEGSDTGTEVGAPGDGDDEEPTKPVVPLIHTNDTELLFGQRFAEIDQEGDEPDFSRYKRDPLEHQKKAVRWLLCHARRALRRRRSDAVDASEVLYSELETRCAELGGGALLADDMGLGKTFSTLVFLREWRELWRSKVGGEPPAVLIVAPLSLLQNWKEEISKSYGDPGAVFSRILLAQADAELNKVQRYAGSRDKAVPGQVLEYGLGFGDGSARSLDFPGSCVLTTYQTLRDYRFSFAKAEWSAAIFDEAQNIKNPNALQTIAAKSLKALFRLTLTGTPVENHLGDFWSILDASEPGPLGSFAEFRKNWITPMTRERDRMVEIGENLRKHVGELMLRRMKEDELTGLPKKSGHDRQIPVEMTAEQATAYDAILVGAQGTDPLEENPSVRQNRQLAALWQLRQVSLHPELLAGGSIANAGDARDARKILERSGKLGWLLKQLDDIKAVGERVLVFCVQKRLQEALSRHLSKIYGINVPIINGDTKAISRRDPEETRLGLIEQFSRIEGFGICILSPIAAGAGLNITAANHVVHLERHWNPAKEDQATDRVYRIGQTRPVSVYLPASRHPDPACRSFDDVLHGLLEKKRGLQGALGLVPPQTVTDSDLIDSVLTSNRVPTEAATLDVKTAIRLPWRLFEALVAVLYERNAERVILTPGGNDHGCDVVILGWGPDRENVLVQCKATSANKLDSEVAVREVEGARPFYEAALNVAFAKRCLHTTAIRLGRRTQHAARVCGVSVFDRSWLLTELDRCKVTLAEVIARDNRRERI